MSDQECTQLARTKAYFDADGLTLYTGRIMCAQSKAVPQRMLRKQEGGLWPRD